MIIREYYEQQYTSTCKLIVVSVTWSDSGLVFLTTGCVYTFLLYHIGIPLRDIISP